METLGWIADVNILESARSCASHQSRRQDQVTDKGNHKGGETGLTCLPPEA